MVTARERPEHILALDEALDELFTKLKLGYVVVSEDDQPRDGWVRVTKGLERGFPATDTVADEEETKAAVRLAAALGLPLQQSRHAVIATVSGARAPLYDSVFLHVRSLGPR